MDSPPANEPHDFDSLSYCCKSLEHCVENVPSGEFCGCVHCAAGGMAPSGFSLGKPLATKPLGLRSLGFSASGLFLENPLGDLTLPLSTLNTLLCGQFFQTAPRIVNSPCVEIGTQRAMGSLRRLSCN